MIRMQNRRTYDLCDLKRQQEVVLGKFDSRGRRQMHILDIRTTTASCDNRVASCRRDCCCQVFDWNDEDSGDVQLQMRV